MSPSTFKAAQFRSYRLDSLEIADLPLPALESDQVLIKVHAASVNPIDWKRAQGMLKMFVTDSFPMRTGYDVSGEIEAVGTAVTGFSVGQAVFARVEETAGTFAEYVATSQKTIALKPEALSHEEAAGVPLAALTAYQPLLLSGFKDRESRKFFVPAGAGGVGMFAIQIAKHLFDAQEVATTVSEGKIETAKKLGATTVINYKTDDFSKTLKDYDFVLDTTGEAQKQFGILKPGGKLYSIAAIPSGDYIKSVFPNTGFLVKHGLNLVSMRTRWAASSSKVDYNSFFMEPNGQHLAELAKLADEKKLTVLIDSTHPFTLEGVKAALERSKNGSASGKVIIKMI